MPTPTAVVINPGGTIGIETVGGPTVIRALVSYTLASSAPVHHSSLVDNNGVLERPAYDIGGPALALTLPDLSGTAVNLLNFRGEPVVIFFWDPKCGYCAQMLDDLKAWEADPRSALLD